MRVLFWVGILVVVVLWALRMGKARAKPDAARHADGGAGEPMVQCAHCGLHLPASEALHNPAGLAFCCEEHRLLHR